MLAPDAPLPSRLAGYLRERFPPAAYTALVALFFGSAALASARLAGGEVPARAWAGAATMWLAFLHLRIFDEHKDFARDVASHPRRLLSRGVVTLGLLAKVAVVALILEAAISAAISPRALAAWAAAAAFTAAMRYEFGVGGWLNRHIVWYAITHNPVVALLGVYAWACTGLGFDPRYLLYLGAASLGSLAFEVGRKVRRPEEEIPGVESYSSALGRDQAGRLLAAAMLGMATCGCAFIGGLPSGEVQKAAGCALLALGTAAGLGTSGPEQPAKTVERGASLALLLALLGMGVAAV